MKYGFYSFEKKDFKVKALKHHKQFAHLSKDKLIKLIRDARLEEN